MPTPANPSALSATDTDPMTITRHKVRRLVRAKLGRCPDSLRGDALDYVTFYPARWVAAYWDRTKEDWDGAVNTVVRAARKVGVEEAARAWAERGCVGVREAAATVVRR